MCLKSSIKWRNFYKDFDVERNIKSVVKKADGEPLRRLSDSKDSAPGFDSIEWC